MKNIREEDLVRILEERAFEVIKQKRTELTDAPKFKILKSQYIDVFWKDRPNKTQMFSICIEEEYIENLDFLSIERNLREVIIKGIQTHNQLFVDNTFQLLDSQYQEYRNTNERFKDLIDLSEKGFCVFFFGQEGVDIFVKGTPHVKTNIFYCEEDLIRYSERKHISEIRDILNIYNRRCLSQQHEYSRFFVSKSVLTRLNLLNTHKNLLKNKPEKFMRDHLKNFLNEHMQHTFNIESELASSKRKIDIYTEVDGQFYFMEVKWLGNSINSSESELGQAYSDGRAREGVTQTLEYIEELIEVMNANVKFGWLIVFDARLDKKSINYEDFKFVKEELKPYLRYFDIVDNLHLDNRHPS